MVLFVNALNTDIYVKIKSDKEAITNSKPFQNIYFTQFYNTNIQTLKTFMVKYKNMTFS